MVGYVCKLQNLNVIPIIETCQKILNQVNIFLKKYWSGEVRKNRDKESRHVVATVPETRERLEVSAGSN